MRHIYIRAFYFLLVFPILLHAAVTSTWNNVAGASWNTAGNWTPATVPNAIDDAAIFNAIGGPGPNRGVTLDINPTLGSLSINGGAYTFVFSAGTINFQVSAGSASFTYSGNPATMSNTFTLSSDTTFNTTTFLNLTTGISGVGSLTKAGGAPIQISVTPLTYGGSTTITAGSILVQVTNGLPTTSDLTINGGSLSLNSSSQTLGSIAGAGSGIAINGASTILTVGNASNTLFSGIISGQGKLTKQGAGTLTLSNANTYQAGTDINNGILKISADNNLGTGNITFNGGTLQTTATFSTSKTITLTGAGTISVDPTFTLTCAGLISGNGSLTKIDTGTLILSAANSYIGATNINAGILRAGIVNALSTSTAVTVNDIFDLNNFNQNIGSLAGGVLGSVTLNGASLTTGNNNGNTNFQGVISGNGALTKVGNGIFTLSGNNNYNGATNINVGTLQAGVANAIPSNSAVTANGIFDLNNFTQTIGSLAGSGSVTLNGASLISGNDGTNTDFSGVISGAGSLSKAGGGIFTLSGNNIYVGATAITSGTIRTGIANALPSSSDVTDNDTFDLNNFNQSIASLSGGGNVILGNAPGAILTTGVNGSIFSGVISGSGGLNKTGAGIFTLSGNNTYIGSTTISSGTLKMGIASALSTSTAVTSNGTFDLDDFSQNIGSLSGGGSVTLGVNPLTTLTLGNDNTITAFSGNISGSGGLTKVGSGMLMLTAANTYTGPTIINDGHLHIGGSITSDTTVGSSGSLRGNGTVIGNVISNGSIKPGASIGVLHVIGNVTLNNGSLYELEISPTSSDQIDITGTLTINPGASIQVIPDFGQGAYNPFKRYSIIITTGGVTGTFSNLITAFPQFVSELHYDPDVVHLIVNAIPFEFFVTKGNPHAVAVYLDSLLPLPEGSDLDNVVEDLQFLSIPELIDAFDQMHPAIFKGNALIQENNLVNLNSLIKDRTSYLYKNACSKEFFLCKELSLWLDPSYDNYVQKATQGVVGFHSNSGGLALGLDYSFNKNNYLGFVFDYTFSDLKWKKQRGESRVNNFYTGLYYTWQKYKIFINSSMLAGLNNFNEKRNIKFPGVARVAKNNHLGKDFYFHVDGGYKFLTQRGINILPFGAFDFFYMNENAFTETNAQSLNLNVKESNYYMLRGEVGANFNKCFNCKNKFIADLKLSYILETRQHGKHYYSNFIDMPASFTVRGINYNRSIFSPGLTLSKMFAMHGVVASLKYNGEFGKKYINNNISIQLTKGF